MPFIFLLLIFFAILLGPSFWAKSVLSRNSTNRQDIPGTGGELAQHLIETFDLEVKLEETPQGDHYDPLTKTVRLTKSNLNGKSLTAVATAAHEVGHAIQHHVGYQPLLWRTQLVGWTTFLQKAGSVILLLTPLLALISRAPAVGLMTLLGGFCVMGGPALIHLITLPVEWNASFDKALPILQKGEYIDESDQKAVRRILIACALTYLASSLSSLLNFWNWIRVLRR